MFNIRLDKTLPSGYPGDSSTIDLATVQLITPPELRDEVLDAIACSIQVCLRITTLPPQHSHDASAQTIWTMCSPFLGVAALVCPSILALMMRRAYFDSPCSLQY